MLKTAFIGSKSEFDEVLVHWLARRTQIVGVVWTQTTAWQRTWKSRLHFFRKRWRIRGLGKAIDEALFFLVHHPWILRREASRLQREVTDAYWIEKCGGVPQRWEGDAVQADDVNAPEILRFLSQRAPDLILATCITQYFGKVLRELPPLGTLVLHEGHAPEYRGLYGPFWALSNLDFKRLGCSVIRMNESYDAGEVFLQGSADDIDPFRDHNFYIGHKSIIDSLPELDRLLRDFDAGTARPIHRSDAPGRYYSYPGLSDFAKQRLRLRRHEARVRRAGSGG